jgi:Zn-dependent M16 (insulinase) family peptidase
VYSSPDSLLNRETQQALFPDNTYGVDSGGDPTVIPDLTFEQFKAFHAKYYHPSNSKIFFYGDDDVKERLDLMDEYLSGFEKQNHGRDNDSSIKFQSKWKTGSKSSKVLVPFAKGTEGKQTVTVNWRLNDKPMSNKDMLALAILDHLLMGTQASSLRKILTDSQVSRCVIAVGESSVTQLFLCFVSWVKALLEELPMNSCRQRFP